MKGKTVIDLVKYLEEFHQEKKNEDLREFAIWLLRNIEVRDSKSKNIIPEEDVNRGIAYLINRLAKFSKFYTRKELDAFNINSIDEFYFLHSIAKLKAPPKSSVYSDTITELTTGTQIMKRLISIGLVEEINDKNDKRIKRVRLTTKGEKVRKAIFKRFGTTVKIKSGNLSLKEKMHLYETLNYLEEFHKEIYSKDADKTIDELINKYLV